MCDTSKDIARPTTLIKSLLHKYNEKVKCRCHIILSDEEYIEELCYKINGILSPDVGQLWSNFMTNNTEVISNVDIDTYFNYFIHADTELSADGTAEDGYSIQIDVCINKDKYPSYNSYTDTYYTYDNAHLLKSIENIKTAIITYCTERNIDCVYDDDQKYIVITF